MLGGEDEWTVAADDLLPSAQFEHTVVVTGSGCEILTLLPSDAGRARQLLTVGRALSGSPART